MGEYAFIAGVPALIGGVLALIASVLGVRAGLKKNATAVNCSIPLGIIGVICAQVAAWLGYLSGAVALAVCNAAECQGQICMVTDFSELSRSDGSITSGKFGVGRICKEEVEAFCSFGAMSFAALILAEVTALILVIAGCFACAACCCPTCYTKENKADGAALPDEVVG